MRACALPKNSSLIFTAVVAIALAVMASSCARTSSSANEKVIEKQTVADAGVIGGSLVNRRDTPAARSVVYVKMMNGTVKNTGCTGVLIDQETVLTAGHCLDEKLIKPFDRIVIQFILSPDDVNQPELLATGWISHPQYNSLPRIYESTTRRFGKEVTVMKTAPKGTNYDHDLGVIVFRGALPKGFAPIPLDRDVAHSYAGQEVAVYGYGLSKDWNVDGTPGQDTNQYHLRRGRITVDSGFDTAADEYFSFDSPAATAWICQGDSGGPQFSVQGAPKVVGINSTAGATKILSQTRDDKGNVHTVLSCKSQGKAMRVAKFADWILVARQTLMSDAKTDPRR